MVVLIRYICGKFEKFICKNKFVLNMYELYYKNTVKKEVELGHIKETDRVLCIGGGAAPCTALQLYQQSRAEIHVLDIDEKAIDLSRDLIKRLGLEEKIKIKKGDGRYIDVKDYDVVHVALQVAPKGQVIKNIWEKSKEGNRIIVRKPKKLLSKFYSSIPDKYLSKNLNKNTSFRPLSTMTEPLILEKL